MIAMGLAGFALRRLKETRSVEIPRMVHAGEIDNCHWSLMRPFHCVAVARPRVIKIILARGKSQ